MEHFVERVNGKLAFSDFHLIIQQIREIKNRRQMERTASIGLTHKAKNESVIVGFGDR